jgi:ethanolamine utilization microcompartment shell protein EutS
VKVKLINIGRNKINKEIVVKQPPGALAQAAILRAVSKELKSKTIEIGWKDAFSGDVIVGGWRPVGQIEIVSGDSL